MASVKSVTLIPGKDRPWAGGLRKRRYLITLTDNDGTDHSFVTFPPLKVPSDYDPTPLGPKYLDSATKGEIGKFMGLIEQGLSPDLTTGKWNTQKELAKPIGFEAFRQGADSPLALGFAAYVDSATANQVANLFDVTVTKANNMKTKAASLVAIKASQDAYVPEDFE